MAGGYHTYGDGKVRGMENGLEEAVNAPSAAQTGTMREVVAALPWTTIIPD